MDQSKLIAERNRLSVWLDVLLARHASSEVRRRVNDHIERLERKLSGMRSNEHVRKVPGTKTYTLRPAPRVKRGPIVEYR